MKHQNANDLYLNRWWNPQGWLHQTSRWIGRSWGWRWFLRLRTLLGQIVRQGINQNPIKRLVDFFNEENHFQTAHNLWHITTSLLQNGGLKKPTKKTNQDPKINYHQTTKFLVTERWPFKMANRNEKKYGKIIDCILFWSIFSVK